MDEPIRCRDACGTAVPDVDAALAGAWTWLEISKGWRCPACSRELMRVNIESRRDCSRCGWTLPEQYLGYVGPCPECSGLALPDVASIDT